MDEEGGSVFTFLEVMPSFPGGEDSLMDYLKNNIRFPEQEKDAGVQGKVFITFVIYKDGSVGDVKVARGVKGGPGLSKEAIRVVSSMPLWKPGMNNGKPVNTNYTLPINFVIRDAQPSKPLPVLVYPNFPGGEQALYNYIQKRATYTKTAKKKKIEGTVYMELTIGTDGAIIERKLTQSLDPELDQQAFLIMLSMPNWIPGTSNGIPAELKVNVPVTFKLR